MFILSLTDTCLLSTCEKLFFKYWPHNELYSGKQKRDPQEAYTFTLLQDMKNKTKTKDVAVL